MVRGDVSSARDALQEPIVVGASLHQPAEAWIGDGGPRVTDQGAQDDPVTLIYQLATDRFSDLLAGSNGVKMLLPFSGDALGEDLVAQRAGLRKDRFGNINCIIKRKRANCPGGCVINRREALRKFYASRYFDLGNELI